jgi:hypothetical protein
LKLKLANLRRGHITRDGLGDKQVIFAFHRGSDLNLVPFRLAFQDVRSRTGTDSIRTVFIDGLVSQQLVDTLRSTLGCPVVSILTHPELPIPICATQMWDFQYLPSHHHQHDSKTAELPELTHSGPPLKGVEVKLTGVEEKEGKKRVLRGNVSDECVVSLARLILHQIPARRSIGSFSIHRRGLNLVRFRLR